MIAVVVQHPAYMNVGTLAGSQVRAKNSINGWTFGRRRLCYANGSVVAFIVRGDARHVYSGTRELAFCQPLKSNGR